MNTSIQLEKLPINMRIRLKKLEAVLEAISTSPPLLETEEEEIAEWRDALLDTIAKKFKEIYAEEEKKVGTRK